MSWLTGNWQVAIFNFTAYSSPLRGRVTVSYGSGEKINQGGDC